MRILLKLGAVLGIALGAVLVISLALFLLLREPPTASSGASEADAPADGMPAQDTGGAAFSAPATSGGEAPRALRAGEPGETGCRIHVADSRGAALAGVPLGVTWNDPQAEEDPWVSGLTDADGRAFVACPAGPCSVAANLKPDLAAFGSGWQDLVVPPGGAADVRLVLLDANARLTAFVHDEKGVALEGVTLTVGGVGLTSENRKPRATDAAGLATWDRMVAGPRSLQIQKAPERIHVPSDLHPRVELGSAASASIDIGLPSKARLNVDLSDPALAAQLEEISIASANPARKSWPFKEPLVSWQLAPGDWTVATRWKEDCAQWAEPQTLTLAPGEVRTITPKLLDGVASLSGRILDRRGVPVALAGVHVNVMRPASATGPAGNSVLTEKIARSDADGVWHLVGLPAGQVFVYLELRAAKQRYLADDIAPSRSLELTAGPRELPEFLVEPGIALKVHLSEEWLAKAKSKDVEVEAAFGPDASDKAARRRRLSRKDDVFVLDHGAIDAYALRITDRTGKTLATATGTIDPATAEGATVDVSPAFTSP
jgi:hypothetical protein